MTLGADLSGFDMSGEKAIRHVKYVWLSTMWGLYLAIHELHTKKNDSRHSNPAIEVFARTWKR